MRIFELIIEADREDHIARHHVDIAEVEDVVFGGSLVHATRSGTYRLIGQTLGGRYLTVFVGVRRPGVVGLITARDATNAERRLFTALHRR